MTRKAHLVLVLALVAVALAVAAHARSGGPPPKIVKEGDGCTCHGPPNSKTAITVTGFPTTYTPATDYTVTVKSSTDVVSAGQNKGGFLSYASKGTYAKAGANPTWYQTGTIPDGTESYVEHTLAGDQGNTASDQPWTFLWKSPARGSGSVVAKVYANRVNGDTQASDLDHWNRWNVTMREAGAPSSGPSTTTPSKDPSKTTTATSPEGTPLPFAVVCVALVLAVVVRRR